MKITDDLLTNLSEIIGSKKTARMFIKYSQLVKNNLIKKKRHLLSTLIENYYYKVFSLREKIQED